MSVIAYPLGEVVELELLYKRDGLGVTGLAPQVELRRTDDNYYFDFNDNTFKSSGWTTKSVSLSDIGSGWYQRTWDSSALGGSPTVIVAEYTVTDNGKIAQDVLLFGASGSCTPADVATAVWEKAMSAHTTPGTFGGGVNTIFDVETGRWVIENNQMIFYKPDNVTELFRFDLFENRDTAPTEDIVKDRKRVIVP